MSYSVSGIWIPIEVFNNPHLSLTDKLLFGLLRVFANNPDGYTETNRTLGAIMGLSTRSITRNLSNLKEQEFISIEFWETKETKETERHIFISPMIGG